MQGLVLMISPPHQINTQEKVLQKQEESSLTLGKAVTVETLETRGKLELQILALETVPVWESREWFPRGLNGLTSGGMWV